MFKKFLQNDLEHTTSFMCFDREFASRLASSYLFHSRTYVNEDFQIIHLKKSKIELERNEAIGDMILSGSKSIMIRYWYEEIIPRLGAENVALHYQVIKHKLASLVLN